MTYLSIRDLQKLSAEKIAGLPGPTPVKSGNRMVGLLIPFKKSDPARLDALLAKAEELAKGRDQAEDDAALAAFGDVDLTNWSEEAVQRLIDETLNRK